MEIPPAAMQTARTGVTFGTSLTAFHLLSHLLRLSSYSIPGRCFGAFALTSSSAVAAFVGRYSVPPSVAQWEQQLEKLEEKERLGLVRDTAIGVVLFFCLGGRFRSVCPSDLRFPGAFSRPSLTLKTDGEKYADGFQRGWISSVGRIYGCHSCGLRAKAFHADHMPPNCVAKRLNSRWYRRFFPKVKQQFYPQCTSCSNLQATVVKLNKKRLVFPSSVRPYHWATGMGLGLIVGNLEN